jgi:hypothetical protein
MMHTITIPNLSIQPLPSFAFTDGLIVPLFGLRKHDFALFTGDVLFRRERTCPHVPGADEDVGAPDVVPQHSKAAVQRGDLPNRTRIVYHVF